MPDLRSILVHVDAGARCTSRLTFARALAAQHDAQVSALMALGPRLVDLPFAHAAGHEAAATMQSIDADRHRRGRASFDTANRAPGAAMHWDDAGAEDGVGTFVEAALCHDLVVLGQHDPADASGIGVPSDFVETVVLGSGRPTLVLPCAGEYEQADRIVLIAWKPGREAARAVDGALPLLRAARQVHVLRAVEVDASPELSVGALEAHLERHGVVAPVVQHGRNGPLSGQALLELADDVGADLLVMGCYGRSRAAERLLGGVTRTVLQSMRLPTLFAH
ncbi:universal stress protein [Caldimonas sp. KR1-144]|uniref:universal stress protein n=1 Tax=Caldimonas sp. KR1-144 TaxID=3400911 RepID=UPI003BFE499A